MVPHLAHELGAGGAGVPRVQAVLVRQQHEQARAQQHGDLGGERVVVAERDLVRGGRVVLVHDRHDAPAEQGLEGGTRVEIAGARVHVRGGQEHLPRAQAGRGEGALPGRDEQALADGGCRLQSRHVRGAASVEGRGAQRDRAGRDDAHRNAGRGQARDLSREGGEQRAPGTSACVHEGRRAELDHDRATHARYSSVSRESPPGSSVKGST